MPQNNRRAILVCALIAAIVALAVSRAPDKATRPLALRVDARDIAAFAVDEQYRRLDRSPPYLIEILAGSGAEALRDGVKLQAAFVDPVDLAVTADERSVFVLDRGAARVRKIYVPTLEVSTAFRWTDTTAHASFRRITTDGTRCFLLSDDGRQIITTDGLSISIGSGIVSDLQWQAGRLLLLDSAGSRILSWTPRSGLENAYRIGGGLDRFHASDTQILAWSRKGDVVAYDPATGRRTEERRLPDSIDEIADDSTNRRLLVVSGRNLAALPATGFASAVPTPLPLFNIEGRALGQAAPARLEYRERPFAEATRMVIAPQTHVVYVLDRPNRRVIRMTNSFTDWIYRNTPPWNSEHMVSSEYSHNKPGGVNRMLWLSHSVFWVPAGEEALNLTYGAPKLLENLLNEHASPGVRWQIVNPGIFGGNFFIDAYPQTQHALQTYAVDYAFLTIDLENFFWFLNAGGWATPAHFDDHGIPDGIDASQVGIDPLQRRIPPPLRDLAEYLRTQAGPRSPDPLLDHRGIIIPKRFIRAWMTDHRLRDELLRVYVRMIVQLQTLTRRNGAELVVFIAPTTNFIGTNEWFDRYGAGGEEHRYDFQDAHRPILEALWTAGIPAYDLTSDLIARNARLFPYNAESHHRTKLFQQAIAESIFDTAKSHDLLSNLPLPPKRVGGQMPSAARDEGVVFTTAGSNCYVVHDLWSGAAHMTTPDFRALLTLAVDDVSRRSQPSDCSTAVVQFVYVRNRDEYGNRDFRAVDRVAMMSIERSLLDELRRALAAGGDLEPWKERTHFSPSR
jgi:hypothetical protein